MKTNKNRRDWIDRVGELVDIDHPLGPLVVVGLFWFLLLLYSLGYEA